MKKSIKIMGLLFTMLLFTGCMKSTTDIVVNGDGSVDISLIAAISNKVMDLTKDQEGSDEETSTEVISEEQKEKAKEKGFEIVDYKEDNYTGAKLTKHFNSIDELATEDEVNATTGFAYGDEQKIFTVKKGFFTNKYVGKFSYNDEKEDKSKLADYQNNEEYKEYFEGLDLSFNITLPSKAKSNNATSVDGNKYTWDLTKFDQDNIEFEFEIINWMNVIIVAVCAIVVVAAIVGAIIVLKKKKN